MAPAFFGGLWHRNILEICAMLEGEVDVVDASDKIEETLTTRAFLTSFLPETLPAPSDPIPSLPSVDLSRLLSFAVDRATKRQGGK